MDWAEFLRAHGEGEGQIAAFGRSRAEAVPIFHCRNQRGLFAATMGLLDVNQSRPGTPPVYTELLLSTRTQEETPCQVLSAVALAILVDGWRVGPGALLENIVGAHVPGTKVPHLFFTLPGLYRDFDEVHLSGRTIHPLACFPVSEAEARLVRAGRGEDLENFWEDKFIDPVDWERDGVL